MKFFCEYCGNRIDAQVEHKCPNCGASYKKNSEFKKLQEEKNKEIEYNKQFREKVTNSVFKTFGLFSIISVVPIIVFILIFIVIVFTVSSSFKNNTTPDINIDIPISIDKDEQAVTANFNEFAVTKNYKVKVMKYEVIEDKFNKIEDGYELIKFHIIVENTSDKELTREDVNCIVDGIAQNNDFTSGYSDLPFFIQKGLAVKGTATFEVPKDAKDYDIKYGDSVTIHIQK